MTTRMEIEVLDNEVEDANSIIADSVREKTAPAGKYVFKDPTGKILKVVTHTGPTKTEQSYKDDTDINRLLEPAIKKGLLRHVTQFEGQYDDIPFADFQEAQFIVAKGRSMYEALPAAIRSQFAGAGEFLKFVNDPANLPWLQKNGVISGLDGKDASGAPLRPEEPQTPASPPAEPSGSAEPQGA